MKQKGGGRERVRNCKEAGCGDMRLFGTAFCDKHLANCSTAIRRFKAKIAVSDAKQWVGSLGA